MIGILNKLAKLFNQFLRLFFTVQHSFSIVIVTWNALEYIKQFLPSVHATEYQNFEIIIANNASDDKTVEWIENHYPKCKIVTFERNYGYAEGNNRAVEYCNGEILLFLNNDVQPEPDWLNGFNEVFMDSNVGVAQPKIRSFKNPEYFEYAGAAGGFIDWMGFPFCQGRIFDHTEMDSGQYDEERSIFWASGAALAIRKDLFIESGGFDNDFQFHMEEIDLCWRCLKMDQKIKYIPSSVIYHLGGGSLPHGDPRKVFYNYRNNLLMLLKNLDRFIFPKIVFRLVLDGISGVRSLLKGNPAETWAIIRAHFSFYGMVPKTLSKREKIKKRTRIETPKNLVLHRLIILEYFLKDHKTFQELDLPSLDKS